MPKIYPNLTFVDCETTGLNPVKDRIIEIAVIRVENGVIKKSFSTLINPQVSLPYYINTITGINNEMLENKPTFYDIVSELRECFKDSLFVSHNSHFDYGFIREEFKRLDISFKTKHLCTVRLFKTLFPKVKRHNLDSLINYFGFECKNRHRALGDCEILIEFYKAINKQFGNELVSNTVSKIITKQSIPPKVITADVEKLPNLPGVYIFYSKENIPLYVGKSINIKDRVNSHFSNIVNSTDLKLIKEVYRIKYIETAGEFGALIKENKLIKELLPIYNKKQRKNKKLISVILDEKVDDYSTIHITEFVNVVPTNLSSVIGVFKNIKSAKEYIIKTAIENKICLKILGLDNSSGACFNYHLGKCNGACIKKEDYLKHNIKFIMAFTNSKFKQWPFNGPKILKEENTNGLVEHHIIDNWRYLGIADNETQLPKANKDTGFDLDEYKILVKFLLK